MYQTRESAFRLISKRREKYNGKRSIFNEMKGLQKSVEKLSWMFDLF